jgi:hypothetical protein
MGRRRPGVAAEEYWDLDAFFACSSCLRALWPSLVGVARAARPRVGLVDGRACLPFRGWGTCRIRAWATSREARVCGPAHARGASALSELFRRLAWRTAGPPLPCTASVRVHDVVVKLSEQNAVPMGARPPRRARWSFFLGPARGGCKVGEGHARAARCPLATLRGRARGRVRPVGLAIRPDQALKTRSGWRPRGGRQARPSAERICPH